MRKSAHHNYYVNIQHLHRIQTQDPSGGTTVRSKYTAVRKVWQKKGLGRWYQLLEQREQAAVTM